MADARITVDIHNVLLLRPGDTLVVAVPAGMTMESLRRARGHVESQLPGVNVVLIEANALAVYHPDPSAEPERATMADPFQSPLPG